MGDANTELLRAKAEEKIVGRELFAIYLGAILGKLVESFPCETRIDLAEYTGQAPFDMAAFSNSDADVKEKESLTRKWEENYERKLAIARGTLLFALRAGLIHSPHADSFIADPSLALTNCTLSERAYAALFRKHDQAMDEQLTTIAKELEKAGRPPQEHVHGPLGKQGGSVYAPALLEDLAHKAKHFVQGAAGQAPHILGIAMGAFLAHVLPSMIGSH